MQQAIGKRINSVGKVLPADAADAGQQIMRFMSPEPKSLDPSIYPYDTEATIFPFEPLLVRDESWNPIPAAGGGKRPRIKSAGCITHPKPDLMDAN